MAVLMPIAGRLYDKIGPRWPAAIGLTVVAVGTYLLCTDHAGQLQRGDDVAARRCGRPGWACA